MQTFDDAGDLQPATRSSQGIRTLTVRVLSSVPLPIGLENHTSKTCLFLPAVSGS